MAHLFLSLFARTFQKVVSAPLCAPRPIAPALEKTRRPAPASMLLKSVPYGAALGVKDAYLDIHCWGNGEDAVHVLHARPKTEPAAGHCLYSKSWHAADLDAGDSRVKKRAWS